MPRRAPTPLVGEDAARREGRDPHQTTVVGAGLVDHLGRSPSTGGDEATDGGHSSDSDRSVDSPSATDPPPLQSLIDRASSLLLAEASATLRLAELRSEFAAIVEQAGFDTCDDEHDPEGATVGFERARLAALIRAAEAEVVALARASSSLSAADYGRCATCGFPIGAERLAALPASRTCVVCATLSAKSAFGIRAARGPQIERADEGRPIRPSQEGRPMRIEPALATGSHEQPSVRARGAGPRPADSMRKSIETPPPNIAESP